MTFKVERIYQIIIIILEVFFLLVFISNFVVLEVFHQINLLKHAEYIEQWFESRKV